MAKQLTIRGVEDELGRRLDDLSRASGKSVNATVLELLQAAVGLSGRRDRLRRYTTWTESDLIEFQAELRAQRTIDDKTWT